MSQYAHPEVLVEPQWLLEHLDNPNVRVVETDLSPQAYNSGHLPGAVFWSASDLVLSDFRTNFEPAAIKTLLARSGITNDTTIIASYSGSPATGAWIFWLLKVFGHADVRVLNGGNQRMGEGYLTTEPTSVIPTDYRAKAPDNNLRVLSEEVLASIERTDCVIVDVRTPQEYRGELFMMEPPKETERAGHIPGALPVFYELALNDDGTFKPFEELQTLYQDKGVTSDKNIMPYCAVGARSAHTWFVLKHLLGYPHVRNYDGS